MDALDRLKNSRLSFYAQALGRAAKPAFLRRREMQAILAHAAHYDETMLQQRLDYYLTQTAPFSASPAARTHKTFDMEGINSTYFYDFKEFLQYFDANLKFDYLFGDNTKNPEVPSFVKSRPILETGQNAILFKLNKRRHFRFVDDAVPYGQKRDSAIFRGACRRPHRREFVERYAGTPRMDIGDTRPDHKDRPHWVPYTSIAEQLQHKFIISIEGNDVATNLKWIMSSNSLCLMRRPRFETWFMEGALIPDKHYVLLAEDFSDLEEKMDYYLANPDVAQGIIDNAQAWVKPFQDEALEQLLCLQVMQRYFELTGQLD